MPETISLIVNDRAVEVNVDPATPLLYVLRNDLGLKGPKQGCHQEQCYACAVLIDGKATPSCQLEAAQAAGMSITTVEGLGSADALHGLQETMIEEQAIQCGFCATGMIISAQSLLNRTRYPSDDEIREALSTNLCRCGVYDRVRRAIRLRIGRPDAEITYEVRAAPPLPADWVNPDPQLGLSPSFGINPGLDAWIRIDEDETVTVLTGKVEIGQGLKTALAQIAAEELDVAMDRMRVIDADTHLTPNEGITAGSQSMQTSGLAVRQAAADARHFLLALAHEELETSTPPDQLQVEDGQISDPASGRSVSYWALFGGRRFGLPVTGVGQPKAPDEHTLVGKAVKRLDLPNKVTGMPSTVHDMELPGMVHGRVVRPPAYDARLLEVDEEPVRNLPGVLALIRNGSFLAVVAEREDQAVVAAGALAAAARWHNPTALPNQEAVYAHLRNHPGRSMLVRDGTAVDEEIPPPALAENAAQTLRATYLRPYQMHASLGASAAVAHEEGGKLTVWVQTQGVFPQRAIISEVLGMDEADVHLVHVEGSGCYGHNGAEDAAMDAALLARALPGRPVSLKWSRADEHGWEPYGPAMVVEMEAALDDQGRIGAWNHDVWSYAHATRPRPGGPGSGLLAAWHLAEPFEPQLPGPRLGYHFGGYRNADPLYDLPRRRIVSHYVPDSPLRTSALRSLGAYTNVFAIESFMDELAHAAGVDPVEFRLRHMRDPRARAVIEAAAEKAGWQPHSGQRNEGRGRGIAFAQYKNIQCYAAIVVDLVVDRESGKIRLERAIIAGEAGQVVNPDGLSNGAPVIETVLLNRPELPFLGSGEATIGPAPAAIANAVFDAVGVRLRRIPFTPERVLEALDR
jgi:CO/xanthine dehydrogenase Mo-binding subunit/aerobic-type carbon monoxide dehydrogenase small subunit (CoxS/CutS family)